MRHSPHHLSLLCLGVLAFCLCNCVPKVRTSEENLSAPFGPSPLARPDPAQEMDQVSLAQMGQDSAMPLSIGNNPEEFDYQEVFRNIPGTGPSNNRWLQDHQQGIQLARTQFKPLLVWFSHSGAESDRFFQSEVLQHEDFLRAARGNVLRVKLDFSNTSNASGNLYRGLKAHYGARGFPYLAVVLPDGSKINEFKGYRSNSRDGYVQNLVRNIEEAQEQIKQRQEQLVKDQGFRWWQGAQQRRVFAKAWKYDQKSERVALRGMWGEQWIVSVLKLQEKDQIYLARWITEQNQPENQSETSPHSTQASR